MTCPRCGVGRLEGNRCSVCGFDAPRREDLSLSVADELERQARRELDREFDILRLVGRGGMSVVYMAQERELGREVALKLLPLHLAMGDDAPDRFKREARIAASLDHPHVVPVHRVGATPRFLWYTMKFVRGRSLADILADGVRLEVEEAVGIIAEVASALDYAHKRGVIHRDVKPGNVILDESGWAWVCDFGVAKAFGALPLTQTGGALGTPAYMSPEQCYGRELDGRADQYALAIVTFECLAGRPPFVAESMGEYVRLHCTESAPRLERYRPDVPKEVGDALARALSKEPEDRFPSVLEFAAALGADVKVRRSIPSTDRASLGGQPITPNTPFPHVTAPEPGAAASRSLPLPARVGAYLAGGLLVGAVILLAPSGTRAGGDADSPAPPSSVAAMPVTGAGDPGVATDARDATPAVPPVDEPPRPAPVLFISTVPIGELRIDGRAVGRARTLPDHPIVLEPGVHVLRVELPGYEPFRESIEVVRGDTVRRLGIPLRRAP